MWIQLRSAVKEILHAGSCLAAASCQGELPIAGSQNGSHLSKLLSFTRQCDVALAAFKNLRC
jgi:hypothetical protein